MHFLQRLRPGVRSGEITSSVRIWQGPRVKAGKRYASMGVGQIEIDSIRQIQLSDVTPKLARESGFDGLVDLLKIAKHGRGSNVYLVQFHCVDSPDAPPAKAAPRKPLKADRQRVRVETIVAQLAEGATKRAGAHLSLEVRGKRFGWLLADHHGDRRIAINCKGSAEMHDVLRQLAPKHFHVPKYLGNKGWVGLWLDVPKLDWGVVEMALRDAYARTAPKRLLSARD